MQQPAELEQQVAPLEQEPPLEQLALAFHLRLALSPSVALQGVPLLQQVDLPCSRLLRKAPPAWQAPQQQPHPDQARFSWSDSSPSRRHPEALSCPWALLLVPPAPRACCREARLQEGQALQPQ